jgi:response regulator RpfG family c-di-GMP phosphodiesterase
MTDRKPRVLCVDDEPLILEGLSLHLRRHYTVVTATSGADGLTVLRNAAEPISVVLCDMRMPEMDGAQFLSRAREAARDSVRILLTGQTDLQSAITAINEGQIFRFLTKPVPPPVLLATLAAAVEQHRLLTSEKVLLEETLQGSIQALADVLSLSNPALFGRALRLKLQVSELAMKLGAKDRWQVEVAAMLSQLGCVALPPDTLERVHLGQRLSEEESAMVGRVPRLTEQMLARIPRLENVRAMLGGFGVRFASETISVQTAEDPILRGSMLLRVAADFDSLEQRGIDPALALHMMRTTKGVYDPEVLDALASVRGVSRRLTESHDIALDDVVAGMVIAEDVRTDKGSLLVARGYEVTAGFVERVRNYPGMQGRTVRVLMKTPDPTQPAAAPASDLVARV